MIRIRKTTIQPVCKESDAHGKPTALRGGATLTEVLMSILVMGIGVLSVITLFPASFLRTLQATNITQSTILRYNADALIDLDRINRATIFAEWQANTPYNVGDTVISSTASGVYNRRFVCNTNGISGAAEPGWDTTIGNPTADNTTGWDCQDHSRYMIDPLGWTTLAPAVRDIYGNDGAVSFVPLPAPPRLPLERFNANAGTSLLADSLTMLPDSWTFQLQNLAESHTDTTVTLPATVDLSQISYYDPTILGVTPVPPSHVILTDSTGRVRHTRWINSIGPGNQINWSTAEPIPTSFDPVEVRIETQERRYTYLLTVRRTSATPSIEVTAFFRRSVGLEDERVFNISNINGRNLTIDHTGGPNSKAPFVKKGGFLLDVDTARWYRIQDSVEWGAGTQTRVTLDKAPIDPIQSVIIPRGVVDVFPIAVE